MSTAGSSTPVSAFDLDLPILEQFGDRQDLQDERRAAAEVGWLARNEFGFTVLHYDDVVAVLRDKRWHSATSRIMEMQGVTDPKYLARRRTSILSAEGDEHTRLRRLVGKAFAPRAADRLRPFMAEVMDGLVDEVAPRGRADIAADICEPYPIPIICELLGAPKEDWKLFSRWATDVLRIFNGNLNEDLPVIMAAQDELDEYTRELIARRRHEPAEDLLTAMIAAEEAGDTLSTDELVMMVEAVIVGGHRHDAQPARAAPSRCSPSTRSSGGCSPISLSWRRGRSRSRCATSGRSAGPVASPARTSCIGTCCSRRARSSLRRWRRPTSTSGSSPTPTATTSRRSRLDSRS